MLEWLVLTLWLVLAAYVFWFLFKAKTLNAIDLDDLALTWRIHRKEAGCKARHIERLITVGTETVGFRCECGYEFIQKRLITQKTPTFSAKKQQDRR